VGEQKFTAEHSVLAGRCLYRFTPRLDQKRRQQRARVSAEDGHSPAMSLGSDEVPIACCKTRAGLRLRLRRPVILEIGMEIQASIDIESLPGDVGRIIAGQKCEDSGNLLSRC